MNSARLYAARRLLVAGLTLLGAQGFILLLRYLAAAGRLGSQEPLGPARSGEAAQPAGEIIAERLPLTLSWLVSSMGIAILLAAVVALLGIVAIRLRDRASAVGELVQRGGRLLLIVGMAVPILVVALAAQSLVLGSAVAGGSGQIALSFVAAARILVLAAVPAALIARSILGDIIDTEQSEGQHSRRRIGHYLLSAPIFALDMMAGWLSGIIVIDQLSMFSGSLGGSFIGATLQRNWSVALGIMSVFVTLTVGSKFLADLLRVVDLFVLRNAKPSREEKASAEPDDKPRRLERGMGCCLVLGTGIVVLLLVVGLFAPAVAPASPTATDRAAQLAPIATPGHPLGADRLGRDILSRVIYALRINLLLPAGMALLVLLPAGGWGMLASRWARQQSTRALGSDLFMLLVRIVAAFPALSLILLGMMLSQALGGAPLSWSAPGFLGLAVGVAVVLSATVASIAYETRVLATHTHFGVRQVFGTLLSAYLLGVGIGVAYLSSASFISSFFGVGITSPTAELGTMISNSTLDVRALLDGRWLVPAFALGLVVFSWFLSADCLLSRLGIRRRQMVLEIYR